MAAAIAKAKGRALYFPMHNAAYRNLIERLQHTIKLHAIEGNDLFLYQGVHNHMEALVQEDSSVSSIGHLFMSCFMRECIPLHNASTPGIEALARAAFKWSMAHEDWTTAAWLMCIKPFNIPLSVPLHPHPAILHALVCNDSTEWPALYTNALKNDALVEQAMAFNVAEFCQDEDALSASVTKYFRQIRKACYFGPGHGLHGVDAAMRWLSLHHDGDNSAVLPAAMNLRHTHPEIEELTRLLQNQWRVDQFWLSGNTVHLDRLGGLSVEDFQSWFWFANAQYYSSRSSMCDKVPAWNEWWLSKQTAIVHSASFWLGLHIQVQGLNYATMRKSERLLAVRDALALVRRPQVEECALPAGYLEIPGASASPRRQDAFL